MNFAPFRSYLTKDSVIRLIIQYAAILTACYIVSIVLEPLLWVRNVAISHTLLELICIFIALSTFTIVWFTYKLSPLSNQIIGYGFLAVAVFDMFHTYYWAGLKLFPSGYFGLSAWHWIMGRFSEAVVILLITYWVPGIRINKWIGLLITITYAAGVSYIFLFYPGMFPTLMTENGVTPIKILFEYVIVALFVISAYIIARGMRNNDFVTYRYILLSLLIAIPGELCFTLFTTITSFYNTLGHVLKVAYYFCLFKGIFICAVVYPYERLKGSKTELEELNRKLEETNKHYYDLLNKLPLALVNYRSDNKLKYANSTALELLGCPIDEVEGLTIKELAAAFQKSKKRPKRVKGDKAAKSVSSIRNIIRTIHNKHGKKINLRLDAHRLENNDFIILFNEAKREQELENLQLQTQTILNCISNTVAVMDRQDKIIMCNKAFERVFEVKANDILGMDRDGFNKMLQFSNMDVPHKVEYEEGKVYEVSIITPDLSKKDILLMPAPVHNIDGERIGYISIGTDITEIKKEQQKIQQQEKLAIIGQMGAGIVHETKNHLALIKGYCQLISLKAADTQLKSYIDRIENISADVNKVIVDFLSLAKPGDTAMDVTSINEIIESMQYMLESPSFMKGVRINVDLGDFEKDIIVEESQIKQVVLNMAKNAIEAMADAEHPKLEICTRLSDSQREVLLIISDNGKGISTENLDKLGKPFFTTKDTGTGLGLSVCYRIINEHGGHINVNSQEGKGTTFTISLPCIEDSDSLNNQRCNSDTTMD